MKKYRQRIYYTEADKALMWDRWQKGESLHTIAIGNPSATSRITRVAVQSGKFRPGNTVEATSMTIQPAMAYRTMTRITRR